MLWPRSLIFHQELDREPYSWDMIEIQSPISVPFLNFFFLKFSFLWTRARVRLRLYENRTSSKTFYQSPRMDVSNKWSSNPVAQQTQMTISFLIRFYDTPLRSNDGNSSPLRNYFTTGTHSYYYYIFFYEAPNDTQRGILLYLFLPSEIEELLHQVLGECVEELPPSRKGLRKFFGILSQSRLTIKKSRL